jgi:hypothetical protein
VLDVELHYSTNVHCFVINITVAEEPLINAVLSFKFTNKNYIHDELTRRMDASIQFRMLSSQLHSHIKTEH